MRRIFVVDDNQLTRMLAAEALRELGWDVEAYAQIEHARVAAEKDPPLAVVLDQLMPDGNGAELVRALRGSRDPRLRTLSIVGLSGTPGHELLEAGADVCLRKPVSENALAAALEDLGLH